MINCTVSFLLLVMRSGTTCSLLFDVMDALEVQTGRLYAFSVYGLVCLRAFVAVCAHYVDTRHLLFPDITATNNIVIEISIENRV